MKRIILFFIIYFCELVVFSQPTGVNGRWEFGGDINIPSGKNFLIGNVPIGGIVDYAFGSMTKTLNSGSNTNLTLKTWTDGLYNYTTKNGDSCIMILDGGAGYYKISFYFNGNHSSGSINFKIFQGFNLLINIYLDFNNYDAGEYKSLSYSILRQLNTGDKIKVVMSNSATISGSVSLIIERIGK